MNALFKKLTFKNLIYPAISIAFAAAFIFSFILAARFLSAQVGKTFALPDESSIASELVKVDFDSYRVVAEKLGMATSSPAGEPTP